jgi:hypothetical protein
MVDKDQVIEALSQSLRQKGSEEAEESLKLSDIKNRMLDSGFLGSKFVVFRH